MIHQRHLLPINIVLWVLLTSVYSIKTNANEHKSLQSINRTLLSSSSDGVDCSRCPISTQDCSQCPITTKDCSQDIITTQNKNECEFTFNDCSALLCTYLVLTVTDPNPTISADETKKYCFEGIGNNNSFIVRVFGEGCILFRR
eukprot:429874_1